MTRKVVPLIPTEDQEQTKFVTWMTKLGIRFYAIPNGGRRTYLEAVKFKRCGVQAGVPDICIPIPKEHYHGLYIELKRKKGGRVSEQQVSWITFLKAQGYYACVAEGFEEAKAIVTEYFSLTDI